MVLQGHPNLVCEPYLTDATKNGDVIQVLVNPETGWCEAEYMPFDPTEALVPAGLGIMLYMSELMRVQRMRAVYRRTETLSGAIPLFFNYRSLPTVIARRLELTYQRVPFGSQDVESQNTGSGYPPTQEVIAVDGADITVSCWFRWDADLLLSFGVVDEYSVARDAHLASAFEEGDKEELDDQYEDSDYEDSDEFEDYETQKSKGWHGLGKRSVDLRENEAHIFLIPSAAHQDCVLVYDSNYEHVFMARLGNLIPVTARYRSKSNAVLDLADGLSTFTDFTR